MVIPPMVILPLVMELMPTIDFIVVDLPAPFGPRKPNISPFLTSKVMSSTAILPLE